MNLVDDEPMMPDVVLENLHIPSLPNEPCNDKEQDSTRASNIVEHPNWCIVLRINNDKDEVESLPNSRSFGAISKYMK